MIKLPFGTIDNMQLFMCYRGVFLPTVLVGTNQFHLLLCSIALTTLSLSLLYDFFNPHCSFIREIRINIQTKRVEQIQSMLKMKCYQNPVLHSFVNKY